MMNRDVKNLYVSLLTRKSARHRISEIKETNQRVALMKETELANKNGDIFKVGGDIYANFKMYTVTTIVNGTSEYPTLTRRFMLCPDVGYFRIGK
jgi:hypothetical protein